MHDIFISYSHKDQARVSKLAAALEKHGYDVWWDRELLASQDYAERIEIALNASRCVLTAWSPHSVASKWVRAESNRGFTNDKLVPVLIEDTNIPIPFDSVHTADLRTWRGAEGDDEFAELLKALDWHLNQKDNAPNAPVQRAVAATNKRPSAPAGQNTKNTIRWLLGIAGLTAFAIAAYLFRPTAPIIPGNETKQGLLSQPTMADSTALKACAKHNPKARNPGEESIVQAAGRGHIERVQECIDLGVDVNLDTENNDAWTALHAAAFAGQLGIVTLLAKNDANIHAKNKNRQTPLYVAVMLVSPNKVRYEKGHYKVVDYLKKASAATNEADASAAFTCTRAKGNQMKLLLGCRL